jgi:acetate kinase
VSGSVAVLNAGSSSLKFGLYAAEGDHPMLFRGVLDRMEMSPQLRVTDASGGVVSDQAWPGERFDHRAATQAVVDKAVELARDTPVQAVGHRVVHGGVEFAAPVRVGPEVVTALKALVPLAPLHQPHNLAPIEFLLEAAPHVPQVACFDTAFHRGQPPLAQMFALPRRFTEAGVRRYGFHGLSYEYVSGRLAEIAPSVAAGRVIVAHLGNGASLCAVRDGRSVASTMGFTAVDGLMMGTRCGALDPGVLIHLMDVYGMGPRDLEDLVYRRSGLLGVSGVASDMRTLRASSDPAAAEAIELFVYRVVREAGSLAAALGGLDAFVFTGGIGENDIGVRAAVGEGCRWLGLDIDPQRNAAGAASIGREGARVSAWVIPTDEERVIARHTAALVARPERVNA